MGLVKGWLGAGGTLWEKNRARRARLGQTDVYLQPPEGYKTNSGVYESPLQVLCDSPYIYRGQVGVEFLRAVPTVWEETRVLHSQVGDHIVIARIILCSISSICSRNLSCSSLALRLRVFLVST